MSSDEPVFFFFSSIQPSSFHGRYASSGVSQKTEEIFDQTPASKVRVDLQIVVDLAYTVSVADSAYDRLSFGP